jgi:hypothetical protein
VEGEVHGRTCDLEGWFRQIVMRKGEVWKGVSWREARQWRIGACKWACGRRRVTPTV